MSSGISRANLFGKLNSIGYKALEGATVFCKLRGNPYVELVHWLHQVMQTQDSDLHKIIKAFNLDVGQLVADTQNALDKLPRGASSISDISATLSDAVERAWVFASLKFGETSVRTGHVIVAMLAETALKPNLQRISHQFTKIDAEELAEVPEDHRRQPRGGALRGRPAASAAPPARPARPPPSWASRKPSTSTPRLTENAQGRQDGPHRRTREERSASASTS
jgi:type VI secretion system protein VasG